jgi:hypothetical protein
LKAFLSYVMAASLLLLLGCESLVSTKPEGGIALVSHGEQRSSGSHWAMGKEPAASKDDTAYVQRLVDAGAIVPPGNYVLRRTIILRNPYTEVQGVGPETVFIFQPSLPLVECWNDRAFTTSCDSFFNPVTKTYVNRRRIATPISIGDSSFQTVDDSSDLQPGDWLVITERDAI